ncbi:hypothetical protein F4803DRAFT_547286 [Xylaria telfairii]|nr:hypothetical protein F4803DRAFT_547286 [Xylaria telfairii]
MNLNPDFNDQPLSIHHGGGVGLQNGDFPPFIIDISDSEDDGYSSLPAKTAFTSKNASLPIHGQGVQKGFECNTPIPHHDDVQYLVELLGLSEYVVVGNDDVLPVNMDVVESEEDVYSPIPAKPASTSQETPPPVHGRGGQDIMKTSRESKALFPSYTSAEDASLFLGQAGVDNGSVLPDIDIETVEKDTYSSELAVVQACYNNLLITKPKVPKNHKHSFDYGFNLDDGHTRDTRKRSWQEATSTEKDIYNTSTSKLPLARTARKAKKLRCHPYRVEKRTHQELKTLQQR